MNREIELGLIDRLLAHVEADTRDLGAKMVTRPIADYVDPVRFEAEREALFRAHPVVIGHVAQLGERGSFLTHDHTGVPIVVTRNEAGVIQAFVNVCRHRGGRPARPSCGNARRLTCGYHGWTHDLDEFWPNRRRVDARTSIRRLATQPRETWRLLDHALNTHFLFPNTQTFFTQDYFSWLSVWPVALDRTICTQHIVAHWAADTDQRRAHLQTNLDLFDLTLHEDFAMSEEVQRGLASGANDTACFGRHEHGAAAVHEAIDETLGRWRAGTPVDAWR